MKSIALAACLCLLAACAMAQDAPAPATAPATQPAADGAGPDPAHIWLDRIETAARKIQTLRAAVRYDRIQVLQGDEQRRFGTMVFVSGPPARFNIHFDKILANNLNRPQDQRWIFDGSWLVERYDDKKQAFKRQIVPPNAPPEQADPLNLGEGPFALPINARKELLLRRFNVIFVPPAEEDPADTIHLRFTPKPEIKIDYDQIDLWYSRESLLPIRGVTRHAGSGNEDIFNLFRIQLNTEVKDTEFDTTLPTTGWHTEITPWETR